MYTYVTIISICNLNKSLTVVINIQNGGIISVSLQLFEVLTYHFFYDLTISCHIISLEWREVRWWFWLFFDVSCFLSYLVNRKLIHFNIFICTRHRTGQKYSSTLAFLSVLKLHTKEVYIQRQCTHILY
jgi:hypothetical protein